MADPSNLQTINPLIQYLTKHFVGDGFDIESMVAHFKETFGVTIRGPDKKSGHFNFKYHQIGVKWQEELPYFCRGTLCRYDDATQKWELGMYPPDKFFNKNEGKPHDVFVRNFGSKFTQQTVISLKMDGTCICVTHTGKKDSIIVSTLGTTDGSGVPNNSDDSTVSYRDHVLDLLGPDVILGLAPHVTFIFEMCGDITMIVTQYNELPRMFLTLLLARSHSDGMYYSRTDLQEVTELIGKPDEVFLVPSVKLTDCIDDPSTAPDVTSEECVELFKVYVSEKFPKLMGMNWEGVVCYDETQFGLTPLTKIKLPSYLEFHASRGQSRNMTIPEFRMQIARVVLREQIDDLKNSMVHPRLSPKESRQMIVLIEGEIKTTLALLESVHVNVAEMEMKDIGRHMTSIGLNRAYHGIIFMLRKGRIERDVIPSKLLEIYGKKDAHKNIPHVSGFGMNTST
jgi:hypothetical protein